LCGQEYHSLGKADKGTVKQYIGNDRSEPDAGDPPCGPVCGKRDDPGKAEPGREFTRATERWTLQVSGRSGRGFRNAERPGHEKPLSRGWHEYADARDENMAGNLASHIYNLRKRREYRERRMVFEKTRPTPVSIGERRKPESGGEPGYIRVDSVHQGDRDGKKGGTTSMPSTRSRNSRSSPPWNIFAGRGCSRGGDAQQAECAADQVPA